ncbi:MAG: hypothetical protein C9356_15835 [Oleiphilus sp.]|nr:MAG: hypothetical protein C9356_15835 [Oleiphilus sp.]
MSNAYSEAKQALDDWEVEIDEDGIVIECRIREKTAQNAEVSSLQKALREKRSEIAELKSLAQKDPAANSALQAAQRNADELKSAIALNKKEETGYKYCRGKTVAPFPIADLILINLDADGLKDWMDTVKTSFQAKKFSETNYVNCMQYDIPVFSDREACAETNISVDLETGEFKLIFELVENLLKTPGHEPMKVIKGFWKFKPTADDSKTLVEYGTYVEPGGPIIPWLYNPRAAVIPFKTIKNMMKVLESGKYKDNQVPFPYRKVSSHKGLTSADSPPVAQN